MTAALPATPNVNHFKWLAFTAALMTYLLGVSGGIVRVGGAGAACGDEWPLCAGQLLAWLDGPLLLNSLHRVATMLATLLILGTAFEAWRGYRRVRWIVWPALGALAALVVALLLGAAMAPGRSPALGVVHLANALILLALLLVVTVVAFQLKRNPHIGGALLHFDALSRLTGAAALGVFAVIIAGAVVNVYRAQLACADWPLCGGDVAPATVLGLIHMGHRYAAGAAGLLVGAAVGQAWRLRRESLPVVASAAGAGLLFGAQVLVGAAGVRRGLPPSLVHLHFALALAAWAGMVVFAVLSLHYVRLAPLKFAVPAPARLKPQMAAAFWDIICPPHPIL